MPELPTKTDDEIREWARSKMPVTPLAPEAVVDLVVEARRRSELETLAIMRIELAAPLNAIIGMADVINREMFGALKPQYREYSDSIGGSGRHIVEVLNRLLDQARKARALQSK